MNAPRSDAGVAETRAGRPIVLAGPTATGKSETAVKLAEHFEGELVGADSVQVYRGFDIGSAKPTTADLRGLKHWLIDVVDPQDEIDARTYADMADRAIADICARGHVPIIVGGTGLWLRALLRGLVKVPTVDAALRQRLELDTDRLGPAHMHARLRSVDPAAAEAIHENDRVRIVRALEVFEQTGEALGELRAQHALGRPRYDALFIVLEQSQDDLGARIEARTRTMLDRGWESEVRALLDRFDASARAFRSVGYRQMVEHVRDAVPIEDTELAINRATRMYARRQRNWFRGEPGVQWRAEPGTVLSADGTNRIRAWIEGATR